MMDLRSAAAFSQGQAGKPVKTSAQFPLAYSLACEIEASPDLAQIIRAWASLPDALRAAIVIMIDSTCTE
jgi:hypothetical protein